MFCHVSTETSTFERGYISAGYGWDLSCLERLRYQYAAVKKIGKVTHVSFGELMKLTTILRNKSSIMSPSEASELWLAALETPL